MKFLDKLLGRTPKEPERTVINHEEQAAPAHAPAVPAAETAPAPATPDPDTI